MKYFTTYIDNNNETLKVVDVDKGIEMAEKVFAQKGLCYRNSFLALREMANPLVEYVEGYAIFYSETFFNFWHHGWLELNGEIIDPYPGMDWKNYGVIYFPCKKYPFKDAMELWTRWFTTGKPEAPFHRSFKELLSAAKVYYRYQNPVKQSLSWKLSWLWMSIQIRLLIWKSGQ